MNRSNYLKLMDGIMRNLNDEEYVMWWLEEGVPDGEDEWDWLAEDEYFNDIVSVYNTIIRAYAKEYPDEVTEAEINLLKID